MYCMTYIPLYNRPLYNRQFSFTPIILSIAFFLGCSAIMAVLGDALAWHRMPIYATIDEAKTHILKDVGFELFPYSCETSIIRRNLQTTIIMFSAPYFIINSCCINHKLINRFLQIAGVMMLLRTITLILTAFPNPNPQCYIESTEYISYYDAIRESFTTFPTKSCGNLMFSGHTMFITLFFLFEQQYLLRRRIFRFLSLMKTISGYYFIIACRSHYTIDIVVSILLTYFVNRIYDSSVYSNWKI